MIVKEVEIDPGATRSLLERMIESAERLAGGALATLHRREQTVGLGDRIKQAIAPLCADLLRQLTSPDTYIQDIPNIRIHRPFDLTSVTPFHSDVLYGHSMEELNYWINLTPAFDTNSLWLVSEDKTEYLHTTFREKRLSLFQFEALARESAAPIQAPTPGVHPFCCGRVHGSVLNETDTTRVSVDLRALGPGRKAAVKKRGGYFRPQWLPEFGCPLPAGVAVTTIASLDEPTPVYLQRMAMEKFYPQGTHKELVEFHGVSHHPTLSDAMSQGPTIAYTIRQLKMWSDLKHPIGFVDERIWFAPGQEELLRRLIEETSRL
jgi:hypothetical protein